MEGRCQKAAAETEWKRANAEARRVFTARTFPEYTSSLQQRDALSAGCLSAGTVFCRGSH